MVMTFAAYQVETFKLMEYQRAAIAIQVDRKGHIFIFAGGCCWQVGKVNHASNVVLASFAWESWPFE